MFRRLIPILLFFSAAIAAFVWFNRVELKERYWPAEEKVTVPAVSYQDIVEDAEIVEDADSDNMENSIFDEPDPVVEIKAEPEPEPELEQVEADPATEIPTEWNLAVPWTAQAPFGQWDHVDDEACEEASVYMAYMFYQGAPAGQIDPSTAKDAMAELVAWQMEEFGYFESTTAEQTAYMVEEVYGLNTELIYNPTIEDIKAALLAGYPVVAPAAGRVLDNPNFTAPGPLYHMLTVKGYTANGFITNDPGTRLGENWVYEFDHFMNSIHDWNGGEVLNGQQVVIVIKP